MIDVVCVVLDMFRVVLCFILLIYLLTLKKEKKKKNNVDIVMVEQHCSYILQGQFEIKFNLVTNRAGTS